MKRSGYVMLTLVMVMGLCGLAMAAEQAPAEKKDAPKVEQKAEKKEAPKAEMKAVPKAEKKEAPKADAKAAPKKETPKAEKKDAKVKVRHVVCLKFKDDAKPEQIQAVEKAFKDLKTKIKEIVSLEMGTNISPEKLNNGFTHCFILTFNSEKDRDAYLVHPDHKAFGQVLGPINAGVFVIDFIAKN